MIESVFLDQNSEGDFLIYYIRAVSFERSQSAAAASIHLIDTFHRQFQKDCWAEGRRLEQLIELAREA